MTIINVATCNFCRVNRESVQESHS